MTNITLAVDEDILNAVRVYAAKNKTSVNALVRDELERIARSEDRIAKARRRLLDLADRIATENPGSAKWKRDDLYER
jgi:hypothetical protein